MLWGLGGRGRWLLVVSERVMGRGENGDGKGGMVWVCRTEADHVCREFRRYGSDMGL